MKERKPLGKVALNLLVTVGFLAAAIGLSFLLSELYDDNNTFAMPVFILSVLLIARYTDGYVYGIVAALIGTFCVNLLFTYPIGRFDVITAEYPLTFAVMFIVSMTVSTMTTTIKRVEKLRFEADRAKMNANLLRAIAHDIRTPLASIKGASSALMDQRLTESNKEELIRGIDSDAQWLINMTENLLTVTKVTGDDVKLHKSEEVLEEIVGSAIVRYRKNSRSLPVNVTMPDAILIVPMDATLIEQVLINLFENVTNHARGATAIWVDIVSEGKNAKISVEDDGEGIPAELMPELFEGNVQKSTQRRVDDTRNMGIGLSVCRTIIRLHGGEMEAGKSSHGGAAVRFRLPCEEEVENVE
ncbi:MAG: DUF4118 domain-containing protein [Clostridia bacterium]|nr:DUF4118 domain-containing protein [Clostridia bacterium]